jgi:hypothetical protein
MKVARRYEIPRPAGENAGLRNDAGLSWQFKTEPLSTADAQQIPKLPIGNFRLPIGVSRDSQSTVGNWKLKIFRL